MKQKTQVTFEMEETTRLTHSGKVLTVFCPRCKTVVRMEVPHVLALLAGSSEREIFRLVEAGMIHFVETRRIYACPDCYKRVLTENDRSVNAFGPKGELQ